MRNTCVRCGAAFDAKSVKRLYCDDCRRRAAAERAVEHARTEGNAALAAARARLGLTQREMAAYLGISHDAYHRAERDGAEPGPSARRKIADKLGVPADELFGELAYIRTCLACGSPFRTQDARARTCPDCRTAREAVPKPKPRRRTAQSIAEIAVQARAAGMSYGKYVAWKEGEV